MGDQALVERTRAGDNAAFDELMRRHRDPLYTLALGSLPGEGEAGDALCEMVLEAYRSLGSWTANCSPGTWLWLHGLRVVLRRLHVSPGRYRVVRREDPERS